MSEECNVSFLAQHTTSTGSNFRSICCIIGSGQNEMTYNLSSLIHFASKLFRRSLFPNWLVQKNLHIFKMLSKGSTWQTSFSWIHNKNYVMNKLRVFWTQSPTAVADTAFHMGECFHSIQSSFPGKSLSASSVSAFYSWSCDNFSLLWWNFYVQILWFEYAQNKHINYFKLSLFFLDGHII